MKTRSIDPILMERLLCVFLPTLPREALAARYLRAPGNEVESGKFFSPKSSAALAANAFGYFLEHAASLPPLPGTESESWPASEVLPEQVLRLPWRGGRHPCLDVVVRTPSALIGIESKRYEPHGPKPKKQHSTAYERDVWGGRMTRYQAMWNAFVAGQVDFGPLDVAQLLKHALAIRARINSAHDPDYGRSGILCYVYADPVAWPDGRPVDTDERAAHQQAIQAFADAIAGDEVRFVAMNYTRLLESWKANGSPDVIAHARAVEAWAGFRPSDAPRAVRA
jgi:hypothetical protein